MSLISDRLALRITQNSCLNVRGQTKAAKHFCEHYALAITAYLQSPHR